MNAKLRNLAWMEFRQRQTQLAVCLLWLVGGTAYGMAYQWSRGFRAPVASFFTTASVYGMFAPIFLAMRTALGETTDRTRSFSDGLPISVGRRGWVRLLGGAGTLAVPILAGALLLSIFLALGWLEQMPQRPPQGDNYLSLAKRQVLSPLSAVELTGCVTAVTIWSATSLYLILCLLGTKLRAESHLGYCGAVAALLSFMAATLGQVMSDEQPQLAACVAALVPEAIIISYGYGDAVGSYGDLQIAPSVLGPLAVNALLQCGLAALFVRGYRRMLPGGAAKRALQTGRRVWWTPRLPARGLALAWLALRQAVPMCLPGLLIALLMTFFQLDGNPRGWGEPLLQRYTDAMSSAMWVIGILWSVVVGAGLFSSEIDWRVGEFWRTRPIATAELFAVKFVAGLLAVLLVLDGSVIAAGWSSPNWGAYHAMNWPYVACFLPLHATMFALAVAWTCLLRRAALGGMAALATFAITGIALEWSAATRNFEPIGVYNHLVLDNQSAVGLTAYPVTVAVMGLIIAGSILIGWLTLRRYDPRRQTG